MKVLFVCRANVGRSQMAARLYNQIHPGEGDSAGTIVDLPGQKLKDRNTAKEAIEAMKELGLDISENVRTQITPDMVKKYDKVVVLCEPESIPDYLKTNPKTEILEVVDAMGKPVEQVRVIRDHLKELVEDLEQRIHGKSAEFIK